MGEGSFGAVYLAEYMHTPVAVKFFKQDLSEKALKKVLAEINVMKKLRHPNIVMLMGAGVDASKQILLLTEYVKRGDLKNCLKDIDSLARRMRIARELARGLHWCHANNITHRDLKLENIFITENLGVKIGDFGLAIYNPSGGGWRNFRGNVKYSAPELLRERALRDFGSRVFPYGQHTDVYSFGLLWYEILTRLSPFKDKPEEYKGREGQAKYTLEGHRPKPPSKWPKELRLLMRSCWDETPSQRPTFAQILNQWDTLAELLLLPSEDKYAKNLSRALWKDQTKLCSFDEFKAAFVNHCMVSDKVFNKDSVLLEELFKENGQVTFENFCHVVSWYGPMDHDNNCINFFSRIRDLKQKFFRGFESKEESDNALKSAYEDFQEDTEFPGYFLMKYSHEEMGEFEVRYINSEGDIYTMTSFNNNGQLEINGYTLESWSKVKVFLKSKHNLSASPKY
uniref:Protein kinase domain-containing protein n=1 Tax=Arcella intermedia TaxID=1963864 RepID=A0A6B2L3R2_9EUKA